MHGPHYRFQFGYCYYYEGFGVHIIAQVIIRKDTHLMCVAIVVLSIPCNVFLMLWCISIVVLSSMRLVLLSSYDSNILHNLSCENMKFRHLLVLALLYAAINVGVVCSSRPPSLDSLAGNWLPLNSLRNMPVLNNFWGSSGTNRDLFAINSMLIPPFAQGLSSGSMKINGTEAMLHRFT